MDIKKNISEQEFKEIIEDTFCCFNAKYVDVVYGENQKDIFYYRIFPYGKDASMCFMIEKNVNSRDYCYIHCLGTKPLTVDVFNSLRNTLSQMGEFID